MKHSDKPLSIKQRQYLTVTLAHKGFRRTGAEGTDETFNEWRHRQALEATKTDTRPGVTISEAKQSDFDALHLHFKTLAGEATLEDAGDDANERTQLMHSIEELRQALGYSEQYLAGICRKIIHSSQWQTAADGRKIQAALRYAVGRKKKAEKAANSKEEVAA